MTDRDYRKEWETEIRPRMGSPLSYRFVKKLLDENERLEKGLLYCRESKRNIHENQIAELQMENKTLRAEKKLQDDEVYRLHEGWTTCIEENETLRVLNSGFKRTIADMDKAMQDQKEAIVKLNARVKELEGDIRKLEDEKRELEMTRL